MRQRDYEQWLCGLDGIGLKKIQRLLEVFFTPQAVYEASEEELRKVKGIGDKELHIILENRCSGWFEKQKNVLEQHGIRNICYLEKNYPEPFRHLYTPPKQIYYIGKMPMEKKCVGIVGARNCSHYGREQARRFAYELAKAGIGIVSGMARGIDGWAHQGALEGGGNTYAVLGNSPEICYPKEHEKLYQSILKRGGVLSEYPPGTEARPGFFPMRNRLISALSDGILVVEAKRKSGSLITAKEALEQGKDVFVVPGRIGDELSEGCNALIKQGAYLVTTPVDIMEHYGVFQEKKKENFVNLNFFLESKEEMVYASLRLEPKHVSALATELKMELTPLMKCIYALSKRGLIKEVGNHYYIRNSIPNEKSN
nr:DNA-processing protein DprA [Eubacterium sp.]